jgi:hypothetical protein
VVIGGELTQGAVLHGNLIQRYFRTYYRPEGKIEHTVGAEGNAPEERAKEFYCDEGAGRLSFSVSKERVGKSAETTE